ncbi:alpha/beta hydrolase [Devosia limi]|nr:alpha/beta fold hydrolase [Devosia limi]
MSTATRPNYWWWTLLAGLIFALAAVVVAPLMGLEISNELFNQAGQVTWLTLFVGVFLLGCLFTWLLMSRPVRFSPVRGGVTGILVTFFAYPLVLTLADLVQRNWGAGTLEARTDHVVLAIGLTLITTGFAAILFGAVVGMAITWLLMRFHRPTAAIVSAHANRPRHKLVRGLIRAATVAALVLLVFFVGSFVWLTLMPLNVDGLEPNSKASTPAQNYEEAIAAYDGIRAQEATMELHERCNSTLLTHGSKVARVVVYFHGLTSCPAQADELALQLFEKGYNVYLPRMFGHGYADPLTEAPADMRAEELVEYAGRSVDLAQGLGDEVVVVGLSAGGTIASWLAQYRSDVDISISVSPFFGPYLVPAWAAHAATNLLLLMPNSWVWWNPLETVRPPEVNYAYARWSSHALGQVMRLGAIVASSARAEPPLAANIDMLLNEADVAVSMDLAERIITSWRRHGRSVSVEVLPFSRRLPHDLIDPREPMGDVELVYPILFDMIDAPRP